MRNLKRPEWLLLILAICIWFPQFCILKMHEENYHEDQNHNIASPLLTDHSFCKTDDQRRNHHEHRHSGSGIHGHHC